MSVDDDEYFGRPSKGNMTANVVYVREALLEDRKLRFTMFVTLSNCRMEHVSEFCRMSLTYNPLQRNLYPGF
jgi:hypothetical protein